MYSRHSRYFEKIEFCYVIQRTLRECSTRIYSTSIYTYKYSIEMFVQYVSYKISFRDGIKITNNGKNMVVNGKYEIQLAA